MTIEAVLRNLLSRELQSRTLREVAQDTQIDHTTLHRFSKGQQGIGLRTASALFDYFDLTVKQDEETIFPQVLGRSLYGAAGGQTSTA